MESDVVFFHILRILNNYIIYFIFFGKSQFWLSSWISLWNICLRRLHN